MQEFLNEKFPTEMLQQRGHNVQQQSASVATLVLANFLDEKVNDSLTVLGHWQFAHQQQQRLGSCHTARQSALDKEIYANLSNVYHCEHFLLQQRQETLLYHHWPDQLSKHRQTVQIGLMGAP